MSEIRGRGRRRGRGQGLAEFALILPVFLLMTLAVVDGARVYLAQISLTNGVREAALFALKGNFNTWCRNPSDPSQADPSVPVSVSCPPGASSANFGADPGNLAYRIAVETGGMDRTKIVLSQPLCGMGPGAPTLSCAGAVKPNYVTVKATYTFTPITPLISQIWGSSVVLTATSTARTDY
jgi:hypothetical protein